MKRAAVLVLALLLSGCLGADPTDEAVGDSGSETDPSREPDPAPGPASGDDDGEVGEPAAPAPPLAGMDLEGIDCENFLIVVEGSPDPATQRVPPGFTAQGRDSVTPYYLYLHHCRSVVLGGAVLAQDVWMGSLHVQVTPPENETGSAVVGYALEAYTDWPVLLDAWARHGLAGEAATFTTTDTPAGPGVDVAAQGLHYQFTPLAEADERGDFGSSEIFLYADDGTVGFDYDFTRQTEHVLARPGLLTLEGGVLGEALPGTGPALGSQGVGAVGMVHRVL